MKKILFKSAYTGIGGVERVQVEYINHLVKHNYAVKLIVDKDLGDGNVLENKINAPIIYMNTCELIDRFQQARDARHKNVRNKIHFNLELIRLYKHLDNKFHSTYNDFNPDIFIDFHNCCYSNLDKIKCKKIAWLHTYLGNWLKSEKDRKIVIGKLKKYDKIVCVSDEVKKELDTVNKKLAAKTISIYNPFNIGDIRQLTNEDFDENEQQFANEKFLLMVSRLDLTCKDYATLFKAFDIAKENGYDGQLYVVGDGEHKNEILEIRSQMKHKENIQLLGAKTNPYKWMKRCDKFILSSTFEGFGNVLVEALVVNDTVISSNCKAGPEEILESGRIGYLFEVGDYNKLAELMINAKPIDRKLIDESIERFSSEVILKQFEELIATI